MLYFPGAGYGVFGEFQRLFVDKRVLQGIVAGNTCTYLPRLYLSHIAFLNFSTLFISQSRLFLFTFIFYFIMVSL